MKLWALFKDRLRVYEKSYTTGASLLFLNRFVNIALPRVRDFRGVSKDSFDGRGNFAVGIKEQIIFPEINYDKVEKIHGMDVVVCTSANRDEEAVKLLEAFGMPYKK